MRISDWSSDVCSSDLERRRNLSGVRTRTGTLIDSAAVPPLREERPCAVAATSAGRHDDLRALRHALAHVATQHLAQERHRDPPLLGQRSAVELVEQPGQARQVAVDAAQQPVDRRLVDCQPAARSEEHTSELQSLMRISYAVFCLKKKKQNNL